MTVPHAHAGNNAAFTGPPDLDCFICRSGGSQASNIQHMVDPYRLAAAKRTTGDLIRALMLSPTDAVFGEAGERLAELDATLAAVNAAIDQLEADYAARKHGGVAEGVAIRSVYKAVGR